MTDNQSKLSVEYLDLCHAMQSGVAGEIAIGDQTGGTTPKSLRVGVNSALVSVAAIVALLVKKGLITDEEYAEALNDGMRAEVKSYEERLSRYYGRPVTLY
jgi:hypothetical protein